MNPQPKIKTIRDAGYLKFIRTLPCVICGVTPAGDSHHTASGGMSHTGDDTSAVPLCREHHSWMHPKFGKRGYWRGKEEELEALLTRLLSAYKLTKGDTP